MVLDKDDSGTAVPSPGQRVFCRPVLFGVDDAGQIANAVPGSDVRCGNIARIEGDQVVLDRRMLPDDDTLESAVGDEIKVEITRLVPVVDKGAGTISWRVRGTIADAAIE